MTLFESELKWLPDTSLEEGLGKTIEWYRENRERIRTAESRHA
jgi:dTDP-D-glucose 4,6-dehydratase